MCCDATITKHKCNAIPTYRSYVLFLIHSWYYRIAGKFGGEINLVVYLRNRQIYQTTKYKSANIFTKVILGLTANISSHILYLFYLHYSSGYSFILVCYYLSQTKINLLFHRFAGPIFWIPKKTFMGMHRWGSLTTRQWPVPHGAPRMTEPCLTASTKRLYFILSTQSGSLCLLSNFLINLSFTQLFLQAGSEQHSFQ